MPLFSTFYEKQIADAITSIAKSYAQQVANASAIVPMTKEMQEQYK